MINTLVAAEDFKDNGDEDELVHADILKVSQQKPAGSHGSVQVVKLHGHSDSTYVVVLGLGLLEIGVLMHLINHEAL